MNKRAFLDTLAEKNGLSVQQVEQAYDMLENSNAKTKIIVLMSDGCESFSWMCKIYDREHNFYYDRNLPYEKFLNPLICQLSNVKDKEERVAEMIDIINVGTTGGKRELDDRTMLLGVLD